MSGVPPCPECGSEAEDRYDSGFYSCSNHKCRVCQSVLTRNGWMQFCEYYGVPGPKEVSIELAKKAFEALDYCLDECRELMVRRKGEWGSYYKFEFPNEQAIYERNEAVCEALRKVIWDADNGDGK